MRRYPSRYRNYWDMNIPTQYYEEDFLKFENWLNERTKRFSGGTGKITCSDHYLEMFHRYEKDEKKKLAKEKHKSRILAASIAREMQQHNVKIEDISKDKKAKHSMPSSAFVQIESDIAQVI